MPVDLRLSLGVLPLFVALGLAAAPAQAVQVSAAYNSSGPYSNTMGLVPKAIILDPGTPNCSGAPFLPTPIPLFTPNTDLVSACNFGTPLTAVQMGGDASSSITRLPGNVYDINLTLTNFSLTSISLPANEYVYLNIWETFTGLPPLSAATWSGGASISGSSCRTSLGDGLFIEPTATVYDPGSAAWIQASPFFGGMPAGLCGAISASATVNTLTSYINAGTLMVGFEVILGLANNDNFGVGAPVPPGDFINLPTSLEFNLRYQPVPGPLPVAGAAMAWSFSRGLRRRIRQGG